MLRGLLWGPPCKGQVNLSANGEYYKDAAIRRMEAKIEEMRQVLVANNLKVPAHKASEASFKVTTVRWKAAPQGGLKEKQGLLYNDETKSHGDIQNMASRKCRDPPSRADSNVDLGLEVLIMLVYYRENELKALIVIYFFEFI